jgi:hypothetical protein
LSRSVIVVTPSSGWIRRLLRPSSYIQGGLRVLNRYLLPGLDSILSTGSLELRGRPPTFIIGPPRCGSTLAIQLLTDALDVGYISNAHAPWFGCPAVAEHVLRWTRGRTPSDFSSELGVTKGAHGPAECGEWWYRFFPRSPAYVDRRDVDPASGLAFRRSIVALTRAWARPVIFKNLYASLRIHPIAAAVPEAIFVIIRRDESDIAASLLRARRKVHGSEDAWFSVEPPDIDELRRLPPDRQVLEQVRSIYAVIERDLRVAAVPSQQIVGVSYADLVNRPVDFIESCCAAMRACGASLEVRAGSRDGKH